MNRNAQSSKHRKCTSFKDVLNLIWITDSLWCIRNASQTFSPIVVFILLSNWRAEYKYARNNRRASGRWSFFSETDLWQPCSAFPKTYKFPNLYIWIEMHKAVNIVNAPLSKTYFTLSGSDSLWCIPKRTFSPICVFTLLSNWRDEYKYARNNRRDSGRWSLVNSEAEEHRTVCLIDLTKWAETIIHLEKS